jgi:gamma-glutamylcyclotransferase (GGCT)/AIG2-like uncharacterized protein YtfP
MFQKHVPEAMSPSLINVFVYGTLKPEWLTRSDANEYQRSCLATVVEMQGAIVHGLLYHLPLGYPALVVTEKTVETSLVYGYVLSFIDSAILTLLDEYEMHEPDQFEAHFPNQRYEMNNYDRRQVEVFTLHHEFLASAWAYVMTAQQIDRLQGTLVPSGRWDGP